MYWTLLHNFRNSLISIVFFFWIILAMMYAFSVQSALWWEYVKNDYLNKPCFCVTKMSKSDCYWVWKQCRWFQEALLYVVSKKYTRTELKISTLWSTRSLVKTWLQHIDKVLIPILSSPFSSQSRWSTFCATCAVLILDTCKWTFICKTIGIPL